MDSNQAVDKERKSLYSAYYQLMTEDLEEKAARIERSHSSGQHSEVWKFVNEISGRKKFPRSDSKALITTGTGKFYSNGANLDWLRKQGIDSDEAKQFYDNLNGLFWRIMHFPIPTVALLNGHTFGAGAVLSSCHDYRVMASERGWLCWIAVKINMRFSKEIIQVLSRKISRIDTIREALIFGKRFTAQEAVDQRLVDVACATRDLLSVGKKLAIGALGPTGLDRNSLQTMKRDLYPRTTLPSSKI